MRVIKLSEDEYAKIVASLNYIVDKAEEQCQNVFTIDKARKGNSKDVLFYETMAAAGDEASKAWNILDKANRKVRVEL